MQFNLYTHYNCFIIIEYDSYYVLLLKGKQLDKKNDKFFFLTQKPVFIWADSNSGEAKKKKEIPEAGF